MGPLIGLKVCGVLFGQYVFGQHFAFLHLKGSKHHGSDLHYLSLVAAVYSFAFTASHQLGRDNSIADDPSCFDFQHFRYLNAPYAVWGATPVPPALLVQLPMV